MTRRTAWFAAFLHPTPARLERWLERQSDLGWEPRALDDMSGMRLHLQSTKPARVRYVVDPQQSVDATYRAAHENEGWKYVGELSSLQVWSQRYEGPRPGSFTTYSNRLTRTVRRILGRDA